MLIGPRRGYFSRSKKERKQKLLGPEFPGSTTGSWSRYVHHPNERGIGAVRYSRLVPKDAASAKKPAKTHSDQPS